MTIHPRPDSVDVETSGRAERPVPFVVAVNLVKRFFGVTVLDGISLSLRAGEVRALLGENGAGKSTVINLLSGVFPADSGTIEVNGAAAVFDEPRAADKAGISVIRQELSLFPDLSVAEAIFAGHLPVTRFGTVDWTRVRQASRDALSQLGISSLDVRQPVASLSIAQQQMVEIARALTRKSQLVIMDEPTASLSPEEVGHLGEIIGHLSREGVAILYVSHRLDEIRAFCKSYTVLRDGRMVEEGDVAAVSNAQLIRAMAGRDIQIGGRRQSAALGEVVLEVRNLAAQALGRAPARVTDVSFDLRACEIVGLAGIVGAGRSETARMIFGIDPIGAGQIHLGGQRFSPSSTTEAIRAGIGLVPEDRKGQAILPQRAVVENFALAGASPPRYRWLNDRAAERDLFRGYVERLGIRASSLTAPIATLSGGNQQKVILSRWIARQPKVLIVDEPTRGIDVGAKEDVHALLRDIAGQGVAVLVISSDLPELMALADRIVVLREGRSVFETAGASASAEELMTKMTRHG
ncbi:ABC-type sugar transport system ATPase subunit [Pararhizobium capsulatum DSM 1112]|uniref:ABC-type sugar transport system ATPase subunit n=1 Tax=Pararhizobium capsulatum DSM 1112 TaxID=1121113 RepID=A0ABU0C0A1_9HYPH|nr:sugar ABC transporter ATP-binding protein [Pararhizobium capsulatum]MDQ0323331.1 ABC-type sugar transport system ATPase subunit [Pararhizobium capsulatum DSM 1112]